MTTLRIALLIALHVALAILTFLGSKVSCSAFPFGPLNAGWILAGLAYLGILPVMFRIWKLRGGREARQPLPTGSLS